MRTRNLLLLAALGSTVLATAQNLAVNVETAGTLKDNVKIGLTVSGKIDKTDFNYLDAFAGLKTLDLKDVTIEAYTADNGKVYTIAEIPDSAFMTSSYINPNGVTVFTGNKSIESVVLPASIITIGASAFNSSVATSIDFSNCSQLALIKDHAFDLAGMEKINLSGLAALKTIEAYAFDQTHATTIVLDGCSALETLDERAFCQSYFVTSTSFKGLTSLKSIGNRAFLNLGKTSGDAGVVDLTACSALETIDESAFQSAKITGVKFPASLKTIGAKAFNLAANIAEITFEGAVPPELGATAFTSKVMAGATVYVPAGSEEAYKALGFENVQSATIVASARIQTEDSNAPAYDLQGRQATANTRGIVVQDGVKTVK